MRTVLIALLVAGFTCTVWAESISLVYDGNTMPDPNTEITVYVHSDTMLFAMGAAIQITGNATITGGMETADCNQFGWDPSWFSDPYIDDVNNWIYISGVKWPSDVNGTVGYVKFIYNSGEVNVFFLTGDEWSVAFDANCQFVPFSTDTLTFGTSDPNQMMMQGGGSEPEASATGFSEPETSIEQQDANDPNSYSLPPLAPREDRSPRQAKNLKYYSLALDVNDIPTFASPKESFEEELFIESADFGEFMTDGPLNTIEITSDITSNQIWTAGNAYHITGDINIQALLVIEPGTIVKFGPNGTLWVNSGGTLISSGTPSSPITYIADTTTSSYQYYWCAVFVESTASPATRIAYSIVKNASVGLWIDDNRLENPIENNYLFHNTTGIVEYGTHHTDIANNLIYDSYLRGIEVSMASYESTIDANSAIRIENNTCHSQYDGMIFFGVDYSDDSGVVELYNNIVSNSTEIGIGVVGYAYWIISNTGYYNNAANTNADDDFPAYATSNPYIDGSGDPNRCYLNQTCPFINTGFQYIEQTHLIGMTTNLNGTPDSNYTDIGFHHPNWNYANANTGFAASDFNHDTITNLQDLYTFASLWLSSVTPGTTGDLVSDGQINFKDYALFAANWQKTQGEPNIVPIISGDLNTGWGNVGVTGFAPDTIRVFVLANGKYIGNIIRFRNSNTLGIDISEFGNQSQNIKLISINNNGQITCSNVIATVFPNSLNYCILPQSYEPNQPVYFAANNTGIGDVNVNVYADGGNLVWSQSYSGNTISGSIPASITNQHEIDYVSFAPNSGTSVSKTSDPAELDTLPPDPEVKALVILPDRQIRLYDFRTISAVQTAFENQGVKYKKLVANSANYWNVAKYATTGNVKYLYIDSHGDFIEGNERSAVLRTGVGLWGDWVVSAKQSDFAPGYAPSWCEKLPGNLEMTTKSFASMGFTSLEFVYFDCCYSGHLKINSYGWLVQGQEGFIGGFDGPHNDMSIALGIGDTSRSRVYQGWYPIVPTRLQIWPLETAYQKWSRLEWQRLGIGDNLPEALTYTIGQQTDFSSGAPVNNYRLKGQGYLDDIELNQN